MGLKGLAVWIAAGSVCVGEPRAGHGATGVGGVPPTVAVAVAETGGAGAGVSHGCVGDMGLRWSGDSGAGDSGSGVGEGGGGGVVAAAAAAQT